MEKENKRKKRKIALGILLGLAILGTSAVVAGVVISKKQGKKEAEEKELTTPKEKEALKEIKDKIKKIYDPEVDKEVKNENQIKDIKEKIDEVLSDVFSKKWFWWRRNTRMTSLGGPKKDKPKKQQSEQLKDDKNLKLKQIDLSKFKTTLEKVKKLNIDEYYKNYVEKLKKEKFEEFKSPLWKKYNQINDFYQKLILAKPDDFLVNADKKTILEVLKSIETRLKNAPLKDYDFVNNLDEELVLFYISRIEPLVFREDYLTLLGYIKEKYPKISTEDIESKVNEKLTYGGYIKDSFHFGYKNLKSRLLANENYNLNDLIPEPKHYEIGELGTKDEIYARIQQTIFQQNTNAFMQYGYFEKVIRELDKLSKKSGNYKTFFQGILYLEKQIVLINERIQAGIEMKKHYDEIKNQWYTYGAWAVNRSYEVEKRIKKTSTTEEVYKAIEDLKNIKEQGLKLESARNKYDEALKNATVFVETLKTQQEQYAEIIGELIKVIDKAKEFNTYQPTVDMYSAAEEKLKLGLQTAKIAKENKDKEIQN
ncbi:hypothetical protein [Mycoplasma tauri]|uniref:Uncharacterized protein n=1 Tax=Mycoplasma tauri TaxID=547987 RepID=A0A953NDB6_9MOLU|nr:hypothetical protein [Mycoplasma tauri]MBZ4195500.1 hypothetical protein [Mycoplasma tauri]MBZ4204427.1 hypothetical protein [Mycoplasma tauri]